MAGNRRSRSKITKGLPPEITDAVNRKLVEGKTYIEIADWLGQMGHEVSKSAVGRYGKDFSARLERLRIAKEQARMIVEDDPDRPATELHEAANQLAMNLIMEQLSTVESLKGEKVAELMKAMAQLERSAVSRERLKFNFNKGVTAAVEKMKAALRAEISSDPELIERLSAIIDSQVEALKQ